MTTAIYSTEKHGLVVILLQGPFSYHWGGPLPILTPQEVLCDGNKDSDHLVRCDPAKKKIKKERTEGYMQLGINQLRGQKVKHGFLT